MALAAKRARRPAGRAGRTLLLAAMVTAALFAPPRPAGADVTLARADQETTFTISPDGIDVTYVTTFNRPAAFIEQMRMDANSDGRYSPDELKAYFDDLARNLVDGLELIINGEPVTLEPTGPPVMAVLDDKSRFQKTYTFKTIENPGDWETRAIIEFHNDNYLDYAGNITVETAPSDQVSIAYDSRWERQGADVRPGDVTDRDVMFRYRKGTGRSLPPAEFTPGRGLGSDEPPSENPPIAQLGAAMGATFVFALAALFCVPWAIIRKFKGRTWRRVMLECWVILAGAVCYGSYSLAPFWDERPIEPPPEWAAKMIFLDLHGNIYDAFAAQTESDIHDTLARGLTGEILDEVYNDVYRSYVARNAGAVKFSVRRVKPISTIILPADAGDGLAAFRVRHRWRIYGTVTHVGHTHARINEYEAVYLVKHRGDEWRIAGAKVMQDKRVKVGQS